MTGASPEGQRSEGDVLAEVARELMRAQNLHGPMHSAHEGYATLLEEVDELWDEVKLKHSSKTRMRIEAVQVAAMAVRFVIDVCGKE